MAYRCPSACLGLCLTAAAAMTGCSQGRPDVAPAEPPVIPVSKPVEREVTDYVDFTGRTDAVDAVDVRARVTGYLDKVNFKEGTSVKVGDVLFEIDPRPYKAQLDNALSQIALYEAQRELMRANHARDQDLGTRVAGAVTQQQLEQDRAAVDEAVARVKSYEASAEIAKLNFKFTKVISPIDERISRYYLTAGNLVLQDQTLLTTIASLDPMYVYFDMDESTLLRIRRAINAGQISGQALPPDPVNKGTPKKSTG